MSEERTVPHRSTGLPLRALRVEVVKGPDAGKTHVAVSDILTVGSAPGNDIVLNDDTVSRYHLELHRREDRIVVQDHGSTNGTSVGSVFIERGTISPGAVLNLGRSALKIDDGDHVTLELHDEDRLGRLRGREPDMRRLMASINRVAQSDISVLLLGETGTGKEVIARAIHEASPRARAAFETVDCGALLPTLIASELFGHERGAFTGADRQHIGAFERADGGTLFLDEIGELPIAIQAALLGALERRSFRRLGGQKPISVNVRVVSATNRDLRAEVNAGQFRQDLYYRIGVVLLRVPPLRERPGDIPLLIEHFLNEAGFHGDVNDLVPPSSMETLKKHHWPGNVRELRNFVDAAIAMGEAPRLESTGTGPPREPADRPDRSTSDHGSGAPAPAAEAGGAEPDASGAAGISDESLDAPYSEARAAVLREFEGKYLRRLIEQTHGNVALAARQAKMDRSYLMQMLKRHGIQARRER